MQDAGDDRVERGVVVVMIGNDGGISMCMIQKSSLARLAYFMQVSTLFVISLWHEQLQRQHTHFKPATGGGDGGWWGGGGRGAVGDGMRHFPFVSIRCLAFCKPQLLLGPAPRKLTPARSCSSKVNTGAREIAR